MLAHPYSLYLVTDRKYASNNSLIDKVIASVEAGVTCVQLREKHCSTKEYVSLAKQLKQALENFQVPLYINDRVDVALASDAGGIHLGNADLCYLDAKKIIPSHMKIGLTVTDIDQIDKCNQFDVT